MFNNLRAEAFDVTKSMLNKNLGSNALNYLCNHDVAHNAGSIPDYVCNSYTNTLFYGLMFLVNRMSVMVFNDDALAYTKDVGFDQSVANRRLKSDNYTK